MTPECSAEKCYIITNTHTHTQTCTHPHMRTHTHMHAVYLKPCSFNIQAGVSRGRSSERMFSSRTFRSITCKTKFPLTIDSIIKVYNSINIYTCLTSLLTNTHTHSCACTCTHPSCNTYKQWLSRDRCDKFGRF